MATRQSPVTRFPGSVNLPDFLNIRQVRQFQDAFFGDPNELVEQDKKIFLSINDEKILPVLLEIVQAWHIDGVPANPTVETFPATPVNPAHELIQWIAKEVLRLYIGEIEVPNE